MPTRRTYGADDRPRRRFPPATTVEGRENQLITQAIDLAEKQIRQGTASAQVITHYLKLGSTTHELEKKKLEAENALLQKRVETLESGANIEKLYSEAIQAMRVYQGQELPPEQFDEG